MRKKKLLIAPSILSADFSCLEKEVNSIQKAGADWVHVDVMDGHFVPNISIGSAVTASIKKRTKLPLDVHLMIDDPWFYLDDFINAGSSIITVHCEVSCLSLIKKIKAKLDKHKIMLGISFNPATPLSKIKKFLAYADLVLVMSVNPGFGGQSFMPGVLPKISRLRKIFKGIIEVDGGITDQTAPLVVANGADMLVAGSYVFKAKNRARAIERLRNAGN
ncbi:MAG: ribulose-phosphate 3-epimerase [Candidatus Omnitrophica bacterium]|nr:ribulose-phosphate 3-epimerase [Candidatus Omnitrophota bacterium]